MRHGGVAAGIALPHLERAAAEVARAAMADALLPGVEINLYQGYDGTWHGNVLLSRHVYPEAVLDALEGYRSVDSGSGRWWYSRSFGRVDYTKDRDDPTRERTDSETREALDAWVVDFLIRVASLHLRSSMADAVADLPHSARSSRRFD